MAENELVAAAADLEDMMRDGKCHEAVMWFIHHLSTEAQFEIASMIYLPLLPIVSHAMNGHGMMSPAASDASREIQDGYARQIQCTDCHLKPESFVELAVVDSEDAAGGAQIAGMAFAGVACAMVMFFAIKRSKNGGDFPYEINMAQGDSLVEMSRPQDGYVEQRDV